MGSLLRQLGVLAAAGVVCLYAFIALRSPNGLPAVMEKRQQLEQMRLENEQLRQKVQERRKHIEMLESSPEERDRAVREHTNKQKQGETTIYLDGNEEKTDAK